MTTMTFFTAELLIPSGDCIEVIRDTQLLSQRHVGEIVDGIPPAWWRPVRSFFAARLPEQLIGAARGVPTSILVSARHHHRCVCRVLACAERARHGTRHV